MSVLWYMPLLLLHNAAIASHPVKSAARARGFQAEMTSRLLTNSSALQTCSVDAFGSADFPSFGMGTLACIALRALLQHEISDSCPLTPQRARRAGKTRCLFSRCLVAQGAQPRARAHARAQRDTGVRGHVIAASACDEAHLRHLWRTACKARLLGDCRAPR